MSLFHRSNLPKVLVTLNKNKVAGAKSKRKREEDDLVENFEETVIAEGLACGIDDSGCLLVDEGTTVTAVNSGEAHVLY